MNAFTKALDDLHVDTKGDNSEYQAFLINVDLAIIKAKANNTTVRQELTRIYSTGEITFTGKQGEKAVSSITLKFNGKSYGDLTKYVEQQKNFNESLATNIKEIDEQFNQSAIIDNLLEKFRLLDTKILSQKNKLLKEIELLGENEWSKKNKLLEEIE
ncbi:MAG: hypothetical protein LBG52_02140 [Candidatus Peribacteria bacterium]|nr:hypothetical protein [Candidatus Peribacteria bacterium]